MMLGIWCEGVCWDWTMELYKDRLMWIGLEETGLGRPIDSTKE